MRRNISILSVMLFILLALVISFSTASIALSQDTSQKDKLVYADFERVENGRVVSNNGGLIQIFTGQESTPVQFKGLPNANPGAPELVRPKDSPDNHMAAFDYSLTGPNQWANVTLEIQGHPHDSGKQVADDVSGYKNLSVQMYATGVDYLRVEFISHDQGFNLEFGFPQLVVKMKPGLNTYLIPLKGLKQPSWVEQRLDTKEVMSKLTAVSISAYCNQCTPQHGTVAVDNLVFQK